MSRGRNAREDFLPALAFAVAVSKKTVSRRGVTIEEYLQRYRNFALQSGLLCVREGLWRVEVRTVR